MGRGLSRSQDNSSPFGIAPEFLPSKPGTAVLVEFSDFQCPACGMYYPLVKQLKSDFGDQLEVVYRHFPLKNIHRNAELAARASEAALIQDKFGEMHNVLFERQKEWSESGQASSLFLAYAVDIGLDGAKFSEDIEKSELYDKVNRNYQEGIRLNLTGTPTFFLNGKKIINPKSYDEFRELIKKSIEQ